MLKPKVFLSILALTLTAIAINGSTTSNRVFAASNEQSQATNQVSYQEILAFQVRVIPMLEDFFKNKKYAALIPATTDYYFYNDHPQGPKIAFVTKKGNEPKIRELRKALERKFGPDVVFESSNYSVPELAAYAKQVEKYLPTIYEGPWSVSYSITSSRIFVDANLTSRQIYLLLQKFDADRLNIQLNFHPALT